MKYDEEPTPLDMAKDATRNDSAGHWPTVAGILLEEVERLEEQLNMALDRIRDLLMPEDGHAQKEAEKFLEQFEQ